MSTKRSILSILLVILLATIPAMASQYACTGPVTGLSVGGGVVTVSGFGGINAGYLCSLTTTAPNGTSPDQCKAMYTRLLIAELAGQSLRLYFSDSLTCTTQPSWAWLNGYYFGPGTI
jgi:hypothetical protein